MSDAFTATAKALDEDPELREKVMSAGSAEERAAILREAGVPVPSHEDVNSGVVSLADVTGAGVTTGAAIGGLGAAGSSFLAAAAAI